MLHIAYIPKSTPSGRGTTVSSAPTRKRPSALFDLWCLTAVFASATADAETDGKCHRGQGRESAAGAGRTNVRAGDRGLSGSGTAVTKHDDTYNLEACLGESVGFMERSDSGTE